VRILHLLEVARQPENMNIAGFPLPRPARQYETLVGASDRELSDHFRVGGRKRFGCRF
jgi:hypothetical protein